MSLLILGILLIGILCGWLIPMSFDSLLSQISNVMLLLLIFSVGIDVGLNSEVFLKIKKMGFKILLIPLGVILGSLLGGLAASLFVDESIKECLAISSGLGWYSLSGILLAESGNVTAGAISFLSNVIREMLTFAVVPFIASHINYYCAIAPAGATAMDTTLAVISRNTNGKIAILAFLSGMSCTLVVPILIPLFL